MNNKANKRGIRFALIIAAALLILALAACGKASEPETTPTPVPTPEPTVDPRVALDGTVICGSPVSIDAVSIDMTKLQPDEVSSLAEMLPYMDKLKTVELGSEETSALSWDDIYTLVSAALDGTDFNYSFTLFGTEFTLMGTEMNFSHVKMTDQGAAVRAAARCMKHLEYIDMDSCDVDDEHMAQIRDENPNAEVVWRIWFGSAYSVRTNVEKILASNPGAGGDLLKDNCDSLKYCTKVKYLDMGHNDLQTDISFLAYMPDLEYLILAMGSWCDISCLENCPNLVYVELQTSGLNDLSPLKNCTKLKALNICDCFALQDISPIYDIDLDYLWVGILTPIPDSQIEEYQSLHPNCTINTTTVDPTEEGWRYFGTVPGTEEQIVNPYYQIARQVFDYGNAPYSYSYYYNDPLY